MRASYALLPDHPVADLLATIRTADELGYYACYGADEIFHKDMWLVFAAAAAQTKRIRLGPNATHVILRDPTMIAQQLATLDELTGGRAEAVFAIGNIAMLGQYHIDWKAARALRRLREAHHVLRTMLADGQIDFEGEFYRYTGVFTAARPVQERIPLMIGAMRGPLSFRLAGELTDGMHQACAYSREALDYAVEHVRVGAERAGRDWRSLDLGAWVVAAVGPDPRPAKEAARIISAFYISAMPRELVERHGLDYDSLRALIDAFGRGDVGEALRLATPELAAKLSLAGTPDEIVERLRADFLPSGFNHVIFCVVDPALVDVWSGLRVDGLLDVHAQLRLIAEQVVPALG
jgi:5,10-methylenetetrahydromethanopterin reductase